MYNSLVFVVQLLDMKRMHDAEENLIKDEKAGRTYVEKRHGPSQSTSAQSFIKPAKISSIAISNISMGQVDTKHK